MLWQFRWWRLVKNGLDRWSSCARVTAASGTGPGRIVDGITSKVKLVFVAGQKATVIVIRTEESRCSIGRSP